MKKKLLVASMFVFGLGAGTASAVATSPTSITPEMSQCVYSCESAGGSHSACWACCVNHFCPGDEV